MRTDKQPTRTARSKPKITVSVDGEELFIDENVEPGYLARFDVDGSEVEIVVDYDGVEH